MHGNLDLIVRRALERPSLRMTIKDAVCEREVDVGVEQ